MAHKQINRLPMNYSWAFVDVGFLNVMRNAYEGEVNLLL